MGQADTSRLQSFLSGRWTDGNDQGATLVNPTTERALATASTTGLDLAAAVEFARTKGGPALRAMSFAERGAALKALSAVIHEQREALIDVGIANAGNTRGDAKFDIDGATGTLAAYAHWAKSLPDSASLPDGEGMQLGRTSRFHGQHVWTSRRGVAVHINAFNFPAWGMMEKAACALLAGVPVLSKPATPTAMMAEHIARLVADAGILPEGAFSALVGSAGDLLDHLDAQDGVAFTGSSDTARRLRVHPSFVERGARLNVEADSLNATVVASDVDADSDCFDLFVRDTAREMTQKAGQKCTATRRIFVPDELVDAACEALAAELGKIQVGDPSQKGVRMGPLTTAGQLGDVRAGIDRLAAESAVVTGGSERITETGYFLAPTLLRARDGAAAAFHAEEVFGPVACVLPYSGAVTEAARLVALGGGGLVTSVYSDDRKLPVELASELAPYSGRLYLAGSRLADQGTGAGTVLPSMIHGGPGRAGGGEELGGIRGLHFWMQRTALQGFKAVVEGNFGAASPVSAPS